MRLFHYRLENIRKVVFGVVCFEEFGGTGSFDGIGTLEGSGRVSGSDPWQLLIEP